MTTANPAADESGTPAIGGALPRGLERGGARRVGPLAWVHNQWAALMHWPPDSGIDLTVEQETHEVV